MVRAADKKKLLIFSELFSEKFKRVHRIGHALSFHLAERNGKMGLAAERGF